MRTLVRGMAVAAATALVGPWLIGCACGEGHAVACGSKVETHTTAVAYEDTNRVPSLPPETGAGECFALVYVPPETKQVTERVCVKEASHRLEVIPAQYDWVEERICVKEASKRLEIEPAEFATEEKRLVINPGHKQWVRTDDADCRPEGGRIEGRATDIFCLVDVPPVVETVRQERVKKPETVREIEEPAQFETVRRQKVVKPACTRRVDIPAEFDTITKTVAVGKGHMEWQRVVCQADITPMAINQIKSALSAQGYDAGALNGQLDKNTWAALKSFQERNRIGSGVLSYATLDKLGVKIQ
jgi:hypothetical protein